MTIHQEHQETIPAVVTEILSDSERFLPGLEIYVNIQEVSVKLLDGIRKGETVSFENEFAPLSIGDKVFVDRLKTIQGQEYYILKDVDRRNGLLLLTIIFVGLTLWFAGWQGIRALGSLTISILAIIFALVPALLAGYDPALSSLLIAGFILAFVLFGTHGFNPVSTISFIGTFVAVMASCIIAYLSVSGMRFTGFSSDAAVFLNFSTGGTLDFTGLLLGSIIIGMLGVLDDVSITQASLVAQLKSANHKLKGLELYRYAIKVGQDHIGSLVNTLALAYVGVSLPLILLYSRVDTSITLTLNQELIAVEITRILIGSIGIILAVPITTAISAWYFGKRQKEAEAVEGTACSHHHNHAH